MERIDELSAIIPYIKTKISSYAVRLECSPITYSNEYLDEVIKWAGILHESQIEYCELKDRLSGPAGT